MMSEIDVVEEEEQEEKGAGGRGGKACKYEGLAAYVS